MDTVFTQTIWGPNGPSSLKKATRCLEQLEQELSLFESDSEIAAINAAAGQRPVRLSPDTFSLLQTAQRLGTQTDGAFCMTVAPLTRLWDIGSDSPQVPDAAAVAAVLPLVNDNSLQLNAATCTAYLPTAGQGLDLGGVAKGYACDVLRRLYLQNGVQHALISIGGNICAVGGRPDGTPFRIGFRDPDGTQNSCIASFLLRDGVVAVSGGYERYFEQEGIRYHHILDAVTGYPVKTDIAAVGVVCRDGLRADLLSTTLFCWGKTKALQWMRTAPDAVLLLDTDGTLYVSQCLQDGFRVEKPDINVIVIENNSQ